MSKKLYFAYGSNLNSEDWKQWCIRNRCSWESVQFVEPAFLPDHDLKFSFDSTTRRGGVLDVVPRLGQVVPGALFEVIAPSGWRALDAKEGAPQCYKRKSVTVLDGIGREIQAETYVVCENRRESFVKPRPDYVDIVAQGLKKCGHPTQQLDAAAANRRTPWWADSIFCYGTLMRGECRFNLLSQFKLECTILAETWGQLADVGAYPGLINLGSANDMVQGDFLRLGKLGEALGCLDKVEGFNGFGSTNSLFRRTLCNAGIGDGRIRRAWVYVLQDHANAPRIPSGNWRIHRGNRDQVLAAIARSHAGDDEWKLANRLARSCPFYFGGKPEAVIRQLLPLANSLAQGTLSEFQLAQNSGQWVTTW